MQKREQRQRAADADAEEHRERFAAAIARLHQAKLQLAQLLRGLRHPLAHPLEKRMDLLGRRVGRRHLLTAADDVAQPIVDAGRLRGQRVGHRGDQQRPEREREQWQQNRHDYTSILMTCLIQKNPTACMTIDAMIIIWPMRSSNSSFM